MRRLGAILMIVGANIIVGSLVAAFWRASFECATKAVNGTCAEGVLTLLFALLFSVHGLGYWIAVAVGVGVFWRGKLVRAQGDAREPRRDRL